MLCADIVALCAWFATEKGTLRAISCACRSWMEATESDQDVRRRLEEQDRTAQVILGQQPQEGDLWTWYLRSCSFRRRADVQLVAPSLELFRSLVPQIEGLRELECVPGTTSEDMLLVAERFSNSLRKLNLGACRQMSVLAIVNLKKLAVGSLEELVVGLDQLRESDFAYISLLKSLRRLTFSHCAVVTALHDLTALKHLEELSMPGCVVTVKSVSELTQLRRLSLSGCQLTSPSGFAAWSSLVHLEDLDLSLSVGFLDDGLRMLACLPALRKLNLHGCSSFSGVGFDEWSGKETLHVINLDQCCSLSDVGCAYLRNIPSLTVLHLRGCFSLTNAATDFWQSLTRVQELDLSNTVISDTGVNNLKYLRELRFLNLAHSVIDGSGFSKWGETLSLLGSIDLSGAAQITDAGFAQLGTLRALRELSLSANKRVTGEAFVQWKVQCIITQSLTRLKLIDVPQLSDCALQHLGALQCLAFLDIRGCSNVTGTGFQSWRELRSLETLQLSRITCLTDSGVRLLGCIPSLRQLELSCCPRLSGSGFAAWARLQRLEVLRLAACPLLSDDGLGHFGWCLASLRVLIVSGAAKLTGSCCANWVSCRNLTQLQFESCNALAAASMAHVAKIDSLRRLSLIECDAVTAAALKPLVELSRIRRLNVFRCRGISDADACGIKKQLSAVQ